MPPTPMSIYLLLLCSLLFYEGEVASSSRAIAIGNMGIKNEYERLHPLIVVDVLKYLTRSVKYLTHSIKYLSFSFDWESFHLSSPNLDHKYLSPPIPQPLPCLHVEFWLCLWLALWSVVAIQILIQNSPWIIHPLLPLTIAHHDVADTTILLADPLAWDSHSIPLPMLH